MYIMLMTLTHGIGQSYFTTPKLFKKKKNYYRKFHRHYSEHFFSRFCYIQFIHGDNYIYIYKNNLLLTFSLLRHTYSHSSHKIERPSNHHVFRAWHIIMNSEFPLWIQVSVFIYIIIKKKLLSIYYYSTHTSHKSTIQKYYTYNRYLYHIYPIFFLHLYIGISIWKKALS